MRPQVSEEHEVCEETQPEQASDCQEGSQEVEGWGPSSDGMCVSVSLYCCHWINISHYGNLLYFGINVPWLSLVGNDL